jgi:hypothetical protein
MLNQLAFLTDDNRVNAIWRGYRGFPWLLVMEIVANILYESQNGMFCEQIVTRSVKEIQ